MRKVLLKIRTYISSGDILRWFVISVTILLLTPPLWIYFKELILNIRLEIYLEQWRDEEMERWRDVGLWLENSVWIHIWYLDLINVPLYAWWKGYLIKPMKLFKFLYHRLKSIINPWDSFNTMRLYTKKWRLKQNQMLQKSQIFFSQMYVQPLIGTKLIKWAIANDISLGKSRTYQQKCHVLILYLFYQF